MLQPINDTISAERSKMSAGSSTKPSGTTKASHRYENDSMQRTQSNVDEQSVDLNNPMDTESEAGLTDGHGSIQRQYDQRQAT